MGGDDMTEHNQPGEWDNVDAGENADHYTEYLETVTGADAVQAYKRRSHQLLKPARGDRILDVGWHRRGRPDARGVR